MVMDTTINNYGNRLINVGAPTDLKDGANKEYVDGIIAPLLDRIKELEEENDKLRKKIKELREEIGELEDEKDELESDNSDLMDQIDEQIDLDDVIEKVVNAIDRRFRRHPNPDPITLE